LQQHVVPAKAGTYADFALTRHQKKQVANRTQHGGNSAGGAVPAFAGTTFQAVVAG
jgi:hypothetical protein